MNRQRLRRPTHPGTLFKLDVIEPLGLTVTHTASALGISRKHLSAFVNARVPCSKELAQRLARATGTSVASWLNMQTALDIWEAQHEEHGGLAAVKRLYPPGESEAMDG